MTNQNTLPLTKGVNNTYPLSQTFNFDNLPVRTVDRDGAVWFVANDVCTILEIANPRNATARLDEDERGVHIMDTPSKNQHGNCGTQEQEFTIISESGLYALVMTSRKAQAKRFKKWVTAEVLPQIRKTGSYSLPAATTDNSQNIMVAYSLAASTANAVSQAVFQAILADPDQQLHHCHYAISLTAGHGRNADNVHLQKIPDGSIVTSLEGLAKKLLEPNGMRPSAKTLTELAMACLRQLARYWQYND